MHKLKTAVVRPKFNRGEDYHVTDKMIVTCAWELFDHELVDIVTVDVWSTSAEGRMYDLYALLLHLQYPVSG